MKKITPIEVHKAIKSLKNNKAAGIDQIHGELLKNGGEVIVNQLTHLFDLVWSK